MRRIRNLVWIGALASLVLSTACVVAPEDPWVKVRGEDSIVDYRRYLSQFPDSGHRAEVVERIAILELMRDPTVDRYHAFKTEFPHSDAADALRPELEPGAFETARYAGTPLAYTRFLTVFPDGPYADRALGNIVFLETGGFTSGVRSLADFAENHPTSDYAEEARISTAALELRDEEYFDRVGLLIRVSPDVAEVQRVVKKLSERATKQFASAGYELVNIPEMQRRGLASDIPRARLVIEHREGMNKGRAESGARPEMLATTVVSLYSDPDSDPIWQRQFQLRIEAEKHFAGSSMLFSTRSGGYWDRFFVPVATWSHGHAVRPSIELSDEIVAADGVGDRVVALHASGEFEFLELASSQDALALTRYQRAEDKTQWSGIRALGSRVVIFGDDGFEIVRFGAKGPEVAKTLDRRVVGSVFAVERVGKQLLIASSRGLLMCDADGGNPRRLLRRALTGLAVIGDSLVLSDGNVVFISTLELIGQQRVTRQLKLGHSFGPGRLVGFDDSVLVLGKGGVLVIDLADPGSPHVISKLTRKQIGFVNDAAVVAGRIFLVGERGLQQLDASHQRVIETLDINTQTRLSDMGRFLVTTRGKQIQLIDTAPFTSPLHAVVENTPEPNQPPASVDETDEVDPD